MRKTLLTAALTFLFVPASVATANTNHEGWPRINEMLLMNKTDSSQPLDARPNHDPFGKTDPRYSCDAIHKRSSYHRHMMRSGSGRVVTSKSDHNKLLSRHGNNTIYAGP